MTDAAKCDFCASKVRHGGSKVDAGWTDPDEPLERTYCDELCASHARQMVQAQLAGDLRPRWRHFMGTELEGLATDVRPGEMPGRVTIRLADGTITAVPVINFLGFNLGGST